MSFWIGLGKGAAYGASFGAVDLWKDNSATSAAPPAATEHAKKTVDNPDGVKVDFGQIMSTIDKLAAAKAAAAKAAKAAAAKAAKAAAAKAAAAKAAAAKAAAAKAAAAKGVGDGGVVAAIVAGLIVGKILKGG